MANTVIGVYDNFAQAQSALKQLLASGFNTEEVRLRPSQDTAQARTEALREAGVTEAHSHAGGGTLRNFFRNLFGGTESEETHADHYAEAVRRGSFVLTVAVDSPAQSETAAAIMEQFQPIDVDERASQWQASGWSRHDDTAAPLTDEELTQERSRYAAMGAGKTGASGASDVSTASSTPATQQTAIPIIEEELKVGKREVQRGGVRVFQRVIETPVQETVNLRQEHVTVERHAVDQPATAAELETMKEGTLELREMAEEAVVSKTARVVEEVIIGKEVSQQQATISDSVRRTDVEVENLAAPTTASATPATATHLIEEDFRHHWQNAYGQSGEAFEDYAPAYQYGAALANDQRYRGHDWSSDEPVIRQQWESTHPHNAWEKVKDAIYYGWNKVAH